MLYKLYGASAGDGVAQLDIQEAGKLIAVWGYLYHDLGANDGTGVRCEASFSSTSGFLSNDTKQSFFGMALVTTYSAGGAIIPSQSLSVSGLHIPVNMGERIYLHILLQGVPDNNPFATVWMNVAPNLRTGVRRSLGKQRR